MIEWHMEDGVRVTVFSGIVTAADLRAYVDEMFADPSFDPAANSLADLRRFERARFDSADVATADREFARRAAIANRRRLAFVTSTPMALGFVRAFQEQHGSPADEIQTFSDMDAARRWVGLA